jgi:hypothetical protein
MQLLSFWTLSIALFLFKPQCPTMSKNSIIVLIYHRHKFLRGFYGSSHTST